MDEGGIYEDGSPEQIFEHPKRENTRRFVHRLKVLELSIESRDYDFIGMMNEIETWCGKNQVAPKLKKRIQLVFEETTQLLIPMLKTPHVQAVCEYSEQTSGAKWTFRYAMARMELTQSDENLGITVLRGMAERMEYSWNETDSLPNSLHITVR
ncbi:MAG: hypothetical protein IJV14_08480 [Lachnospiraceae bacterium]|nr:hypothetical protein [Lachnospiraceae bacterium]